MSTTTKKRKARQAGVIKSRVTRKLLRETGSPVAAVQALISRATKRKVIYATDNVYHLIRADRGVAYALECQPPVEKINGPTPVVITYR
jgi:hypothetical protein